MVAAQTLREIGFGGRVVMMNRENCVPYDHTILRKYLLSGEQGAEKSPLQKQSFCVEHRVERRSGEVVGVDPGGRSLRCTDGSSLRYDALLLATAGKPKRPVLPGSDLAGVFVLRSRADADAILFQAERSVCAVIIGGGLIRMRIAASLRDGARMGDIECLCRCGANQGAGGIEPGRVWVP